MVAEVKGSFSRSQGTTDPSREAAAYESPGRSPGKRVRHGTGSPERAAYPVAPLSKFFSIESGNLAQRVRGRRGVRQALATSGEITHLLVVARFVDNVRYEENDFPCILVGQS